MIEAEIHLAKCPELFRQAVPPSTFTSSVEAENETSVMYRIVSDVPVMPVPLANMSVKDLIRLFPQAGA